MMKLVLTYWLFALSVAVSLYGCNKAPEKELQAPLRQVRSMVVDAGTGMVERTFSGRLHSSQETSLSFKVSGTIQDIAVNVGDPIKNGDVIATLDPSPYALEVQRAQASLSEAQAMLTNAKANYMRIKKLYKTNSVSRSEFDNARASLDSAAAIVESAHKVLEIARLNLSYTKLTAADDCMIASVDAEEGENVVQGKQIFYTTCGDDLEVDLDIPESVIAGIKKDSEVKVIFPAIPGKVYKGKVYEVGVSSIQGGTTFPVTIALTGPHTEDLKPGLSADVAFSIGNGHVDRNSVVIVPPFAVGEDPEGRFVFILNPTQQDRAIVKRRPVTIGNILQSGIEVLEGLEPGIRVVTAGVSVLHDGMEVKYDGD
jgi:RND family efflux transporter MFP subunit